MDRLSMSIACSRCSWLFLTDTITILLLHSHVTATLPPGMRHTWPGSSPCCRSRMAIGFIAVVSYNVSLGKMYDPSKNKPGPTKHMQLNSKVLSLMVCLCLNDVSLKSKPKINRLVSLNTLLHFVKMSKFVIYFLRKMHVLSICHL